MSRSHRSLPISAPNRSRAAFNNRGRVSAICKQRETNDLFSNLKGRSDGSERISTAHGCSPRRGIAPHALYSAQVPAAISTSSRGSMSVRPIRRIRLAV